MNFRRFLPLPHPRSLAARPRALRVPNLIALGLALGLAPLSAEPLKVVLLVGQSNMQGHAHVRTLEHLGMDPTTTPLLRRIQDAEGKARVSENVWISSLSGGGVKQGRLTTGYGASEEKIGPELSLGLTLQEHWDGPILLIKTAWGGKSLNTDFRSPSAGPFVFNDAQLENFKKQGKDLEAIKADKAKATGHYYRLMLQHVRTTLANLSQIVPGYDAAQGYALKGLVWFQGWNDMVDRGIYPQRDQPGGYDAYSDTLAHFIRDVRRDLETPALPFIIGVMGAGGPVELYGPAQKRYAGIHQNFRDAMAAPAKLPEFKDQVRAVLTEVYWDQELVQARTKEAQLRQEIRQQISQGKLDKADERATLAAWRQERLSERERKVMEVGVSNQEYHYLGSAKILAQIGVAFAEAVMEMNDPS